MTLSKNVTLSASILSAADFSRLGEEMQAAEAAGVDWIHVDVMDGHFVPNITMGPFIVAALRKMTSLPLDVHLMIENPERHIRAFAEAGANLISVHLENNPNVHRTLQEIRILGCRPGVALNPGTPASAAGAVLGMVDFVLAMTVNPGYSGQKFLPETASKVQELRRMLDVISSEAQIEVDGGIDAFSAPVVFSAGARIFVAATALFKYPEGIAAGARALRACCL